MGAVLALSCAASVKPSLNTPSWKIWSADSMTNVLRTGDASGAIPPLVSLARNEFEGIQIVVAAGSTSISGLRWSASTASQLQVKLNPIGYVHAGLSEGCPWNVTANPKCKGKTPIDCGDGVCRRRAKFACTGCSEMGPWYPTTVQWWPYVILDYVDQSDVAQNTVQPLLLTVFAPPSIDAGEHQINVTVRESSGLAMTITVQVEVFDVALKHTPTLPTFWGVAARDNPSIWGKTASSPAFAQRFADFLLDHRVPVSSLYGGVSDWTSTGMYR